MAAGSDAYLHDAIDDAGEIDAAGEFAQTRSHALHGLLDASLQILRVQGVEQKQAAGDGVVAEFVDDRGPGTFALEDDLHDPVEARPVHIHEKLHEFLAGGFWRALRHLIELRNQLSELSNLFLEFAAGSHVPPFREVPQSACHVGTERMALLNGKPLKSAVQTDWCRTAARCREYEPGRHWRQAFDGAPLRLGRAQSLGKHAGIDAKH